VIGRVGGARVEVTLPAGMASPAAGSVIEADIVESVPIIFAAPETSHQQR
jgi:hypothetical protein